MAQPYSDYVLEEIVVELRTIRRMTDVANTFRAIGLGMFLGALIGVVAFVL